MTTEQEQRARLEKAIQSMVADPDIQKIVKDIESSIPVTKGHYGRYMTVLSPFVKDKISCFVVSRAMLRLGANEYGVSWALKILFGGC